jgi:hypothetical protein
MLLILLESPWWVRSNEGDLESFRSKGARDIEFWVVFIIESQEGFTYFGKMTHKKKFGLQLNGLAPMLCAGGCWFNVAHIPYPYLPVLSSDRRTGQLGPEWTSPHDCNHQLAILSIGWAGWFASFSFVSLH